MQRNVLLTFVFCILPLWWIFSILWLPGFMHLGARLSYSISPIQISDMTASSARDRAYAYATHGANGSDDIYFTRDEISHLDDVSRIYRPIAVVLNTLAVVAWSVLFLAVYKKVALYQSLRSASRMLTVFMSILIVCLLAFSVFFEKFHKIFFPQGNWAFPADSVLIALFPESFWKLMLFFCIVGISAIIILYRLLATSFYERFL